MIKHPIRTLPKSTALLRNYKTKMAPIHTSDGLLKATLLSI